MLDCPVDKCPALLVDGWMVGKVVHYTSVDHDQHDHHHHRIPIRIIIAIPSRTAFDCPFDNIVIQRHAAEVNCLSVDSVAASGFGWMVVLQHQPALCSQVSSWE